MSNFDTLVTKVLRREGGYVNNPADRGGETNRGISKNANPDVDVANLDDEKAKVIYKERYWDKLNGDALPENVRDLAFDTAVHHGVGRAKQWLTQAGNDPAKLLAIRKNALQVQATQPKQGQFLNGWMKRLSEFEGGATPAIVRRQGGVPDTPQAAPIDAKTMKQQSVAEWAATIQNQDKAREAEQAAETVKVANAPGTVDRLKAAAGNATTARIMDVISGLNQGFENVEGYEVPREILEKATNQLDLNELKTAKSPDELRWVQEKQRERDERSKIVFSNGMASGMGITLGVEIFDPTNLSAMILANQALGRSAVIAARAGQTARAIGMSVAENVAVGTAIQGTLALAEGRPDPVNALVGLAVDVGMGLGVGAWVVSAGRRAAQAAEGAAFAERAAIGAAEREARGMAAALLEAPNASRAELQAISTRILTDELIVPMAEAQRPRPVSRQLMERPADDMADDVVDGVDPSGPAPKLDASLDDVTDFSKSENAFNAGERSLVGDSWAQAGKMGVELPAELAADSPGMAAKRREWLNTANSTPGVTLHGDTKGNADWMKLAESLESLRKQLIPDVHLHVTDGKNFLKGNEEGMHRIFGKSGSIITLRTSNVETMIHEFGHAVMAHRLAQASPARRLAMRQAFDMWSSTYKTEGGMAMQSAALERSPLARAIKRPDTYLGSAQKRNFTNPDAQGFTGSLSDLWDVAYKDRAEAAKFREYFGNFNEYSAEQVAKFIEAEAAGLGQGNLSVPQQIFQAVAQMLRQALEFFGFAKKKGLVRADASFEDFLNDLLLGNTEKGLPSAGPMLDDVQAMSMPTQTAPATPVDSVNAILQDPVARLYGMDMLPVATTAQRAEAKAMIALANKAEEWAKVHPKDAAWDKRAENIITNPVFDAASAGLKLLRSENPIARMIANELLEDSSGVAGKRASTAAIGKDLTQKHFMGNVINDIQDGYSQFLKTQNTGMARDQFTGGKGWERYNRMIAEEIEARRAGSTLHESPHVQAAADSLEAAYNRMAKGQRDAKTLGHQALWEDSRGYMPHRMSPSKWLNLDNDQRRVIHSALTDQFISIKGWDMTFADKLASDYLQRVRARAVGGFDAPMGGSSAGAATIVEDALIAMNMTQQEVRENMKRFNRGAANFTKARLDLDLLKSYNVNGKNFQLLDVFEIDHTVLVRGQANRASGEVALANHGVYGKPGLQTIRNALAYSPSGKPALETELRAFDQIAAEFMDEPFGSQGPKWLDNARALTTTVRLGSIVFNQFAEFVNGVFAVGAGRVMKSMTDMPRLRREVKALARGEQVDNSIIGSIERLGGGEFGTDSYKLVMPFDMPGHAYQTYGTDTVTGFDKFVRGASYLQSKLSLWRAVHSVQERGMAEQITAKIARFSRDDLNDVAMQQFGITPEMKAAIKADGVARWDESGSLIEFDITKISDPQIAEDLIHAVHRGVKQIIQGTYIGERGIWAHDGYLKAITQFKTFSLTSMEKQWGRQRNSRGIAGAAGILMASALMVIPVYMARVGMASIGREDQDEYIEKMLAPTMVARQTLNYVAMGGLAGDFVDGIAALAPDEWGVAVTGGRAGSPTGFIGSVVAPSAGLVDDAWKALQQAHTHPDKLLKVMPGSRLPGVLQIINSFGD
jgi:hypothetical protein